MRKSKKIVLIIFVILFVFNQKITPVEISTSSDGIPEINAEGYVVMDSTTHDILFSKNEDVKYPPASTTKIMTALLALENVKDLQTKITIGKNPPLVEPSSIFLVEGEIIDIESLLYATLLQSANDAAEALGEYMGGSREGFCKMMNEKAKELGCTNTNFVNASGLHDQNQYTTAHDLALILNEAIKNATFLKISTTEQYFISQTNLGPVRELYNQNRILLKENECFYDKAICAKTGYTDEAQHTFAVAARDGNKTLIATFLMDSVKGYNIYAKDCFEYGFKNFTDEVVLNKGNFVTDYNLNGTNIQLGIAEDVHKIVKNGQNNEVSVSDITLLDKNKTNFKQGEEIATATLMVNGVKKQIKLTSINNVTIISHNSTSANTTVSLDDIGEKVINSDHQSLFIKFWNDKASNLSVIATLLLVLLVIFLFLRYKSNVEKRNKRSTKK